MNATVFFPTQLHWTAQDLADAVPLRLHELFAFDAGRDGASISSANGEARPRQPRAASYAAPTPPPFFRVR